MTPQSEFNNRLRQAINTVEVPPGLGAAVRSSIGEAQAESAYRARLQGAVQSEPAPAFLETRIRARIASERPIRRWVMRLAPVSAAAAIAAGLVVAYQLGYLRLNVRSQESYIASISTHVGTLMRVGLGDHVHCSFFRKFPKTPPPTDQFIAKLGPEYAGLIPIVRENVPSQYQLMLAHQCKYHNRKFIHLSLLDGSHLLSLVISRKGDGESFQTEGILPALVQSDIPMYQSGVQRFEMTAFETRDHLVYFISDLPKGKNTQLMLAMGPQVKALLARLES
jgi:hypothetical protein